MKTQTIREKGTAIYKSVPDNVNTIEMLISLRTLNINHKYFNMLKNMTNYSDEVLAGWLDVSPRTLQSYKKPGIKVKETIKEKIMLLLTLFKHGSEIFGSGKAFDNWLNTVNFYFDGKKPNTFLKTVTGIRFIDDRLTAMEYGDNV